MELKHIFSHLLSCYVGLLLIVPYGIETSFAEVEGNLIVLLIVPYGIETQLVIFLFVFCTYF